MKTCSKCNQSKDSSEFYTNIKSKDKLQNACKDCLKQVQVDKALAKNGSLLKRDTSIIENEIWLIHPDAEFNAMYEVSNFGRVRSYRSRKAGMRLATPLMLVGGIHRATKGSFIPYPYFMLVNQDGKKLFRKTGRLVLEAFVGPRPDGSQVSHLDDDPSNSNLTNLAWETSDQNQARKRGKDRIGSSLNTAAQIRWIVKRTHRISKSQLEAKSI